MAGVVGDHVILLGERIGDTPPALRAVTEPMGEHHRQATSTTGPTGAIQTKVTVIGLEVTLYPVCHRDAFRDALLDAFLGANPAGRRSPARTQTT
jgi:hypothetical protein